MIRAGLDDSSLKQDKVSEVFSIHNDNFTVFLNLNRLKLNGLERIQIKEWALQRCSSIDCCGP